MRAAAKSAENSVLPAPLFPYGKAGASMVRLPPLPRIGNCRLHPPGLPSRRRVPGVAAEMPPVRRATLPMWFGVNSPAPSITFLSSAPAIWRSCAKPLAACMSNRVYRRRTALPASANAPRKCSAVARRSRAGIRMLPGHVMMPLIVYILLQYNRTIYSYSLTIYISNIMLWQLWNFG